jgi:hypothetical protein
VCDRDSKGTAVLTRMLSILGLLSFPPSFPLPSPVPDFPFSFIPFPFFSSCPPFLLFFPSFLSSFPPFSYFPQVKFICSLKIFFFCSSLFLSRFDLLTPLTFHWATRSFITLPFVFVLAAAYFLAPALVLFPQRSA